MQQQAVALAARAPTGPSAPEPGCGACAEPSPAAPGLHAGKRFSPATGLWLVSGAAGALFLTASLAQAEFFVLEYASSLMCGPSTWHLAVAYLAWCPRCGEASLAALVEQVAAAADRKTAQRLLQVCGAYDLSRAQSTVCRVQAEQARKARPPPRLRRSHAPPSQWLRVCHAPKPSRPFEGSARGSPCLVSQKGEGHVLGE